MPDTLPVPVSLWQSLAVFALGVALLVHAWRRRDR